MNVFSIIWAAVIAIALTVALTAADRARGISGDIAASIGTFAGCFLISLLIMFIVEKISGRGKKVYVTLSDEEAIALLNKTISAIPPLSAAAVKNKKAGNFAWCNDFLSSDNNISQLRAEAWRRTKTKFTDEELKQYFRLWFYRL